MGELRVPVRFKCQLYELFILCQRFKFEYIFKLLFFGFNTTISLHKQIRHQQRHLNIIKTLKPPNSLLLRKNVTNHLINLALNNYRLIFLQKTANLKNMTTRLVTLKLHLVELKPHCFLQFPQKIIISLISIHDIQVIREFSQQHLMFFRIIVENSDVRFDIVHAYGDCVDLAEALA